MLEDHSKLVLAIRFIYSTWFVPLSLKRKVRNTLRSKSGDEQEAVEELIQHNNVDGCSKLYSIKFILPVLLIHNWQLPK